MSRPRLQKKLGQHHLVDVALTRPLLEFLAPAGQRVVEIGPGGGILTSALLAAGAQVIACEIDLAWAFELAQRLKTPRGGLQLVALDALELPWARLPAPTLAAGNLPYNVGTAILERLLPHHEQVPRAAFLLQKEVAERLLAQPGDAAYGALSLRVQARAEVSWLGRVKAGSFHPPPKVEGAFVGLRLRPPPIAEPEMEQLTSLLHLAFGQRRKTLRNSLGSRWGHSAAEAALAAAGLSTRQRAEEISLGDFLRLHRAAVACGKRCPL